MVLLLPAMSLGGWGVPGRTPRLFPTMGSIPRTPGKAPHPKQVRVKDGEHAGHLEQGPYLPCTGSPQSPGTWSQDENLPRRRTGKPEVESSASRSSPGFPPNFPPEVESSASRSSPGTKQTRGGIKRFALLPRFPPEFSPRGGIKRLALLPWTEANPRWNQALRAPPQVCQKIYGHEAGIGSGSTKPHVRDVVGHRSRLEPTSTW
jgi:hypothetical protein